MLKTILIADDAAFMRMMIKTALEGYGPVDVHEASDGQDCVAKYNEIKPDLVLLDITMPNLDGIGALREIKKIDPKASVIMCSAMGQEGMVVEAIKLGALDFIVKPFKPDRIMKALALAESSK